jgi:hypothetical protein
MTYELNDSVSSHLWPQAPDAAATPALVANLHKQWDASGVGSRYLEVLVFEGDALRLGAGTTLALAERRGIRPDDESSANDDGGLVTLLGAAYRGPTSPSALAHIRRATFWKAEGDEVMALTHLALTGLGRLKNPLEDSRRLFVADALMKAGVNPRNILLALELDTRLLDELMYKYSPDQPRVPAGNGRESGQWVGANSVDAATLVRSAQQNANDLPISDAAYQGDFHDTVRDHFVDILKKAGHTAIIEVPLTLAGVPPITARLDILSRSPEGAIFGIEVKTGVDPTFTPLQMIVYPHVEAGGLVITLDPRVSALGLTPGVPLPHIDLYVLYASGPGATLDVHPMLDYMYK